MPTVKLGRSRQVVIPKKIHDALELKPGDLLDVALKGNKVVFTPKALVDKRLAEALADIRAGRVVGPFNTAAEAIHALHARPVRKRS